MAERYKFQFSLPNGRITKSLEEIPKNYRGLFVEMALKAWFIEKNQKDAAKLSVNAFAPEKHKASDATRIRVTISNQTIISGLRAISRKRRSFVAELALNVWMSSKPGEVAFEMLTSRGKEQLPESADQAVTGSDGASSIDEFFNIGDQEASDTERLIKSALAFK